MGLNGATIHNRHLLARMLVILFAIALVFSACRGNSREKGEVSVDGRARMKVAIPRQPISATYYIAASQGFFAAERLDVEIIETATGKEALQRVMSGEADLASTAETPVVHAVVNGEHLAVLATTATTRGALEIVARSDRGIREASDLAGRRVGVALGTNVEFFLDIFLTLHHVNRERMEIVDTDAADMLRGMTA